MQELSYCTSCFKTLGVSSRMKIFKYLTEHADAMVSDVVKYVGLSQPTISYHLTAMKENGLLVSHKNGKEVHYSLSNLCPHSDINCVLQGMKFPSVENVKK